ncbi:MAG: ANTAR domain-containing protein [Syntrophomonadaceae bacterium]|nr:ANTAR domain-containing protein [Syntrophomonadaceae bacterium]
MVRLRDRIILASVIPAELKLMNNILQRAGYQVTAEADSVGQALRKVRSLYCDLIIIDSGLDGGKGYKLAEIVDQDRLAAVLMITDTDVAYFKHQFAYILKPISSENLIPAVKSALWNWRREEELRQRISHLENKLETRILVDRAKGILMDIQGWTEEQAHRYIQKEAMNQGITARQMATMILQKLGKTRGLPKKEEE